MSEKTCSFKVDETLMEQFAARAKKLDRDWDELLRDLMRDFLLEQEEEPEYEEWVRQKVQVALDSVNAGRVVSAEEAEARFAAKRAETLRKMTGPAGETRKD